MAPRAKKPRRPVKHAKPLKPNSQRARRSRKRRGEAKTPLEWVDWACVAWCYCLSTAYIGYTTTPPKRERQHQRELVGGANGTRRMSEKHPDLRMVVVVGPFLNKRDAQQFEWRWRFGSGGPRGGLKRRLEWIATALDCAPSYQWTTSALPLNHPLRVSSQQLPVHVHWIPPLNCSLRIVFDHKAATAHAHAPHVVHHLDSSLTACVDTRVAAA